VIVVVLDSRNRHLLGHALEAVLAPSHQFDRLGLG
jgi:hypothetical protein